ncbi:MAG: YihY/virulence factor BrkB family protein [Spirochaetales bacterium]
MSLRDHGRAVKEIVVRAFKKYGRDDPIQLAGTTAYFVIFAVAPILIIITSVLGLVIDEQTVSSKLFDEINSLVGEQGGEFIQTLVQNFQESERNVAGTIIGVVVFLIASTTFFSVLQHNLNFIWRVRATPKSGVLKTLKDRLLSFGLILSLGFILLISLVIDAALAFFRDFLEGYVDRVTMYIIEPANFIVSFLVVVLVFALIFKFLPDAKITWRVTWIGAIITAALFTIGKFIIGTVLASANLDVMYGAAGSVVVLVLWVFYSSIILYFGAEVTQQFAHFYHHDIGPQEHAVKIAIQEVAEEEEESRA